MTPEKIPHPFQEDFNAIIADLESYYPGLATIQIEKVKHAFIFGAESHKDQKRASGEPYFTHPVAATKILMSIKPDIDTVCACLLHDVIEDTPVTASDVEKLFGKDVRFLCEGVEKVAKIRLSATEKDENKFENIQKLLVAMAKDIRIIFIKLADRIHNLSTLQYIKEEKQKRIAQESLEVYAPIAEKLGLHQFKSSIDYYCFSSLYPAEFDLLIKDVKKTKKTRQKFIDKAQKELLKKFEEENCPLVAIETREKELYSIFKKMKRKNISSLDDVYDFLGVRIIVNGIDDCYRALGIIHSTWRPAPKRFKDYIAVPKQNGYQSLHTTVLGVGQNTLPTEIQIRTHKMHTDAEYGPAAHWAYKQSGHSNFDQNYLKKMEWLPRKFSQQKNATSSKFFEHITKKAFAEKIYVFTPKGEVKFFNTNSTAIDFAYAIHSEIGDTCIGAKINGITKPLNYQLKNGDIIQIITQENRSPNPDWLNFVQSESVKDKIKSAIRKNKKQTAQTQNIPIDKSFVPLTTAEKVDPSKQYLVIGDEINLPSHLASCCKPQLSDPILAYKSLQNGFGIHHANCKEVSNLDPERIYEAHYLIPKKIKFTVSEGHSALIKISSIINSYFITVHAMKTTFNPEQKTSTMDFILHVHTENGYQQMMKEIEATPYFIDYC